MLVSTTLPLGFAWVARNAIVRLLADIRARQLGAIMETIADLADEVDRERDDIPRSVDAPVTLLKYGDWECPARRRVCRRKRRAFWDMHDRLLAH
jgi:hypothetical protein